MVYLLFVSFTKTLFFFIYRQAATFGLTFLGDGATIKRMPLCNVLAMCGDNPPVLIAIHDCTGHMASGGKKDAEYIAGLFEEKVAEYDPKKVFTNLFFFDGAGNMQKGGEVLTAKYPRAYCFHGGEHVVSLFFSNISKLMPIKVCTRWNVSCGHIFHST